MALIPSYLQIGSAVFPLQIDHGYLRLTTDLPGIDALGTVLSRFRSMPPVQRQHETSQARDYVFDDGHVTVFRAAAFDDEDTADGSMNWFRLTGAFPRKEESFHVGTSFLPDAMMIPQSVLFELINRLAEIDQGVANGTIELRLDDTPVPPRLPASLSITTYDRLWICREAEAKTHALKVMRGEPWTPLPEEPDYEPVEYDEPTDDDQPEPQGLPLFTITPTNPIPTPAAIANGSILRELETMAIELDALDEVARAGGDTYEDAELEARWSARRRRLLIELEVAGLFERSLTREARDAVAQLPALRAFHDAAMQLHAYLDSRERADVVRKPRPQSLLDSDVSIDWFRVPVGVVPDGMAAWTWLALVELQFERPPAFTTGRRFTRLAGRGCTLLYRTEARATPSVWRAT
jgi:hypothetical protein